MQDARETVRGAKLYFCSQTEIQERYKVTMSQIYLEMNHIKKTFGELEVLKDISLSVHKGEVVSVIGPSGSGKSTLLRCATMLEKMDGGELSFLGEKAAWEENGKCVYANKKQLKEIRKNFGLVFQNFNLFPQYTALQNVMLAGQLLARERPDYKQNKRQILAEIEEQARALLAQMGLSDRENHYPHQLSGGQQQRVAIARALVNNPRMIIADEPTGNLDSRTSKQVLYRMLELSKNNHVTFVMVTHEPELAECADRIVTILDGKVCSNVLQDEQTKKKNRDALFADLKGDLSIGGDAAKEQSAKKPSHKGEGARRADEGQCSRSNPAKEE